MINDNREDFLPPVVVPPVRRDPNIGIERDRTPPFSAPSFALPRQRTGLQIVGLLILLAVLLAVFLVGVMLLLHAITWAVIFLWNLT